MIAYSPTVVLGTTHVERNEEANALFLKRKLRLNRFYFSVSEHAYVV